MKYNALQVFINEVSLDATVQAQSANSGGDCYEAAGRYMMQECSFGNDDCDIVLVHGEVGGQGPLEGVRYGHAWIEVGDTVVDKSNGRDIQMPKSLYYLLGKIGQPDMENWGQSSDFMDTSNANLHKYEWGTARKKILDYEHWGPWDLETSSGL